MKKFSFNLALSREIPRLCFGEMPILEKSVANSFKYDADSDIAVIVPIFFSAHIGKYRVEPEIALHGFMKRAMYQAYELLNFTDLRGEGIHYYITAHQTVKKRLHPYLEACQFPEDRIIWSNESTDYYPGHLIKFPFMREVLREKKINKVFSFDSAVYFVKERNNDLFQYIRKDWTDQPIANLVKVWREYKESLKYGALTYESVIPPNHFPTPLPTEDEYLQKISDALGLTLQEFKAFWSHQNSYPVIEGRTTGLHRSVLEDNNFWDILNTVKSFLSIDQPLPVLYWQKYLRKETDIIVPEGISWYPKHAENINDGNIGFLDSSKSIGEDARRLWIEKQVRNL